MTDPIHISRNYVEFGTFKLEEVLDFKKRGIIKDSDYLRTESTHAWTPAGLWLSEFKAPAPKDKPAAKKAPVRKRSAPKKAA